MPACTTVAVTSHALPRGGCWPAGISERGRSVNPPLKSWQDEKRPECNSRRISNVKVELKPSRNVADDFQKPEPLCFFCAFVRRRTPPPGRGTAEPRNAHERPFCPQPSAFLSAGRLVGSQAFDTFAGRWHARRLKNPRLCGAKPNVSENGGCDGAARRRRSARPPSTSRQFWFFMYISS